MTTALYPTRGPGDRPEHVPAVLARLYKLMPMPRPARHQETFLDPRYRVPFRLVDQYIRIRCSSFPTNVLEFIQFSDTVEPCSAVRFRIPWCQPRGTNHMFRTIVNSDIPISSWEPENLKYSVTLYFVTWNSYRNYSQELFSLWHLSLLLYTAHKAISAHVYTNITSTSAPGSMVACWE